MTADENVHAPWWDWVERQLDNRGMSTADLTASTGLDRSRFTEWRKGKRPTLDTARLVAKAFGLSPLEVMVAARLIRAEEADLEKAAPDPASLTNQELLAELRRRLDLSGP